MSLRIPSVPVLMSYPHVAVCDEPCTDRIIFSGTAADGAVASDPFAATWNGAAFSASTVGYDVSQGGRLLTNPDGKRYLRVTPYCTTSGAVVTFQLFGFSFLDKSMVLNAGNNTVANSYLLERPTDSGVFLGPARSMFLTTTGAHELTVGWPAAPLSALLKSVTLTTSGPKVLIPASAGGTTYYEAASYELDARGYYAFMPRITGISAGTVTLLGSLY